MMWKTGFINGSISCASGVGTWWFSSALRVVNLSPFVLSREGEHTSSAFSSKRPFSGKDQGEYTSSAFSSKRPFSGEDQGEYASSAFSSKRPFSGEDQGEYASSAFSSKRPFSGKEQGEYASSDFSSKNSNSTGDNGVHTSSVVSLWDRLSGRRGEEQACFGLQQAVEEEKRDGSWLRTAASVWHWCLVIKCVKRLCRKNRLPTPRCYYFAQLSLNFTSQYRFGAKCFTLYSCHHQWQYACLYPATQDFAACYNMV